MKKYFSMIAMALMLSTGFTACSVETDEEPGGTNIEKMCGYWDVMYYAVDASGNVLDEWADGTIFTYNRADNGTTQMFIDDQKTYWAFQFLVDINYAARTFSATERDYDAAGSGTAVVTNGKIMEGAGKNLHGMPCDSIAFEISFSDDDYPEKYGFDHYLVTGTRHTGFTE
jgi:hypothetical protein